MWWCGNRAGPVGLLTHIASITHIGSHARVLHVSHTPTHPGPVVMPARAQPALQHSTDTLLPTPCRPCTWCCKPPQPAALTRPGPSSHVSIAQTSSCAHIPAPETTAVQLSAAVACPLVRSPGLLIVQPPSNCQPRSNCQQRSQKPKQLKDNLDRWCFHSPITAGAKCLLCAAADIHTPNNTRRTSRQTSDTTP